MSRVFAIVFALAAIAALSGCNQRCDRCDECDQRACLRCDYSSIADCREYVPAPPPIASESPKKTAPILPPIEVPQKPLIAKEAPKAVVRVTETRVADSTPKPRKMRTGETLPDL